MAKGAIKRLLPDRRYGFVNTEEATDPLFHEYKTEGVLGPLSRWDRTWNMSWSSTVVAAPRRSK
jgi:hypothetical protein